MAMTKIYSTTLTTSAYLVYFYNIPQTYKTLVYNISGRGTVNANYGAGIRMTFNQVNTGYTWLRLEGYDSSTASQNYPGVSNIFSGLVPTALQTTNAFGVSTVTIPNYGSSTNKSVSIEYAQDKNANTDWDNGFVHGIWANTTPISGIMLTLSAGNFDVNSTFTLYGEA